ncbi:glycerol-3-phosphate responsive antiterminator [Candidatus Caldatribacterium saccharofermentans]|uniref:glycerol-3-phosphate responsive antiterminator n=1 Tax=Candidatus Caldatribacterium saccharofermentans TaxID=1454753 RepID=UPI003CFC189A
MSRIGEVLRGFPVIGALRSSNTKDLREGDLRLCSVYFILEGDIFEARRIVALADDSVAFFLHLDLFGGIAPDEAGFLLLRELFPRVRGIISTRARTLTLARRMEFITIFRLFCIDSESLRTGLKVIQEVGPDAVEVLPGIVFPKICRFLPLEGFPPVICGGFIRTPKDVRDILKSGALAVSTSAKDLWKMNEALKECR